MCGRFSYTSPVAATAELFGVEGRPNIEPRYNIAPTQAIATVIAATSARARWQPMRWGLPSPCGDGTPLINARSETAAEKPTFAGLVNTQRCLVPADGYYEWLRDGRDPLPYYVRVPGTPSVFAALWAPVAIGEQTQACTILTRSAEGSAATVHHRMPVIIDASDVGHWLDPAIGWAQVADLIAAPPPPALVASPVDPRVGKVGFDGPDCHKPYTPPARQQLSLF